MKFPGINLETVVRQAVVTVAGKCEREEKATGWARAWKERGSHAKLVKYKPFSDPRTQELRIMEVAMELERKLLHRGVKQPRREIPTDEALEHFTSIAEIVRYLRTVSEEQLKVA